MDGMHDLGGKEGFGPVRHAEGSAVFKAAWEPRANALYSLAVRLGIFNMDEYRHAIERMEPRHYLAAGYYERSLTGFATLCVEKGVVSREEWESLAKGLFPLSRPGAEGRPNAFPRETFKVGDRSGSRTSSSPVMSACLATFAEKSGSLSLNRRRTRFRTPRPTIFKCKMNPPTTSASKPRTSGRRRRTRQPCMSPFFRATWKKHPDRGRGRSP